MIIRSQAVWTLSLLLCSSMVQAQIKDEEPEPLFGQVIIVGNTITRDRVIRDALDLRPGAKLQLNMLQVAERKLASLGLFKVDPEKGIRPTVQALNAPGQCKDILVIVEEGSTLSFKPVIAVTAKIGYGIAFVLEERNFDPWRLPCTIFDFPEGKAFRGGGQTLQVGIAVGTLARPQVFLAVKP